MQVGFEMRLTQRFDRKAIEAQVREHLTGWRALRTDEAESCARARQLCAKCSQDR
jgi:hypothetical protein